MTARTTSALIVGACLLGGCSQDASPRLEIDVVNDPTTGWLTVFVRDLDEAPCCDPDWSIPEVDTCEERPDYFLCTPGCRPWRCLRELRIERDGQLLARVDLVAADRSMVSVANPLAPGDEIEAVFDGCGGATRVPLSGAVVDAPVIVDLLRSTEQATVLWSNPPGTARSIVEYGLGYGGGACGVGPAATSATLPIPSVSVFGGVSVTALSGPVLHQGQLGTIRVWNGATASRSLGE